MLHSNFINSFISDIDNALRTLFPAEIRSNTRPSPAKNMEESALSLTEKKQISGLMRVNHAGEVAAQALYQAQALTARSADIKNQMQEASAEEIDHLAWCEQRLHELGSQPSLFNPVWYLGAFVIGAVAGFAGDRLSLGFVAETEHQVSEHLQKHLNKLPVQDNKTRIIIEHMQEDEIQHAKNAMDAGGMPLPIPLKILMRLASKVMTKTSYYI